MRREIRWVLAVVCLVSIVNLYISYRATGGGSSQLRKVQEVHLLYSIGCGGTSSAEYQLIQALALDHSWSKVRQRGRLTRLVSGCKDDNQMREYMERTTLENPADTSRFDVWFSETAESLGEGKTYRQFNRPNALLDFLHNYGTKDDVVYVMLDPDFIFLRPLPDSWINKVEQGRPVAAYYSLGLHWIKWGAQICKEMFREYSDEQCKKMFSSISPRENSEKYEAGAPYFMLKSDWLRFLPAWMEVMPRTFDFYSGIESDMYAYMITSVRLGLVHSLSTHFMSTCMISESQQIHDDDVFIHYCQRYFTLETRGERYFVNDLSEFLSNRYQLPGYPPYVYTFSKYWMQARGNQKWMTECDAPLIVLPPTFDEATVAGFPDKLRKHYKVLHLLVPAVNDGVAAYKKKYCKTTPNLETRMILHEAHRKTNHMLNSILPPT